MNRTESMGSWVGPAVMRILARVGCVASGGGGVVKVQAVMKVVCRASALHKSVGSGAHWDAAGCNSVRHDVPSPSLRREVARPGHRRGL